MIGNYIRCFNPLYENINKLMWSMFRWIGQHHIKKSPSKDGSWNRPKMPSVRSLWFGGFCVRTKKTTTWSTWVPWPPKKVKHLPKWWIVHRGKNIYSTLFNSNKPLSKLGMDKYSAIVCALHPFQAPWFQKQKVGFKATHGWQVDIVRR